MGEETDEIIKGHEYDGIQEFDNPLPMWWLTTFLITVIFGFLYWIHYQFGGGPTLVAELKSDMSEIQSLQKSTTGPTESEDELKKLLATTAVVSKGHAVFDGKCAVCHGPQGQGLIGPNLTDDFWIHGQGKLVDIITVVRQGVLEKGMPNWESQLPKEDIQAVTVYVASLHGSNPPNPKAPQGNKVGN